MEEKSNLVEIMKIKQQFLEDYCDFDVTSMRLKGKKLPKELTKETFLEWSDEYGLINLGKITQYPSERLVYLYHALGCINKEESLLKLIEYFESLNSEDVKVILKSNGNKDHPIFISQSFIADRKLSGYFEQVFCKMDNTYHGLLAKLYYQGLTMLYKRFAQFLKMIVSKYSFYCLDMVISLINFAKEYDRELLKELIPLVENYFQANYISDNETNIGFFCLKDLGYLYFFSVIEKKVKILKYSNRKEYFYTSQNYSLLVNLPLSITDDPGVDYVDNFFFKMVLNHLYEKQFTIADLKELRKVIDLIIINQDYDLIKSMFNYFDKHNYIDQFANLFIANDKDLNVANIFYDSKLCAEYAANNYFQTGKRYVGIFGVVIANSCFSFSFPFLEKAISKYAYLSYDVVLSLRNYYYDFAYFQNVTIHGKHIDEIIYNYQEVTNPYNYLEYLKPLCDRGLEEEYNEILSNWDRKHRN